MSAAPTLLEAAKLAKAAIVGRWQSGNGNARIESLENEAVERCTEAIAAAESACTETRVRFVVEYMCLGKWKVDARCDTEVEAGEIVKSLPRYFTIRIVRETSVITREVLP